MGLSPNFLQDLIAATQGGTIEPAGNAFGEALSGPLPAATSMPASAVGQPARIPSDPVTNSRPRRSVLDIIGGVGDVFATVGGAPAQYQPNLDARLARQNAAEDRTRMIDIEALKKQQMEQQLTRGTQEIEGGSIDLQNAENGLIGSAGAGLRQVFGRSGAAGVQKAWPLVAQTLGIPPEQAEKIGAAFQADPEGTLAALFPDPVVKAGSKAKEVQIYELLKADDPEAAEAYAANLTNPTKPMSEYQREQVRLAEGRLGLARDRYENPPATAGQRTAGAKGAAAAEERAASAANLDATLNELTGIYDQLNDMGAMVNPKKGTAANIAARLRASGAGQLVEGAVGTQAQELRDRVESIRPGLMQQLAKATGMTGKQLDSNADVKLFMQTVTDPTRSYEANQRAIKGLRRLLTNPPRAAAPAAAPKRSGGGAAPQRKIVTVTDTASYNRLPKGTRYVDPNGVSRVKQ